MAVAKKVKQPSKKGSATKPKKETVKKASKAPGGESKQAEGKKSARIRKQTATKTEPKTGAKSVKTSKKAPPKQSSSPQGKPQNTSSKPQKPLVNKSSLPPLKKSSPQSTALSSKKKTRPEEKPSSSPKAKKAKVSAAAGNRKEQKAVANVGEVVSKPANTKRVVKPTKEVVEQLKASKQAVQSGSKKPSIASKIRKAKRKSVESPLKKKLGGKIVKSKTGPLSKKRSPLLGKKAKKPSKNHLKLAMKQNRGVVYFSHLPHGFYEDALENYCRQFGDVTGVHVPRSVNGKSKGFAFVEFKHPEVAEIVAETMNNYLMHTRLVKAELVPLERQKPWIFRNGLTSVEVAKRRKADALAARTRKLTPKEEEEHQKKALERVERLRKKLSEKGINLDFTVVT